MDEPEGAGIHAALASPVRRRVLDVLGAAAEPPTAQRLAAELGLHITTVRFHLDQLEQAGLVARRTSHTRRRGRPGVHWVALGGESERAREQMIAALAEALAGQGAAGRQALAAGRRWADQLATGQDDDPAVAIADVFTRLGFDPEPDGDVIRLRACPFRDAARQHPEVVCQVHLGLAQGLAAKAGATKGRRAAPLVGLLPFVEPQLCLITLDAGSAVPS